MKKTNKKGSILSVIILLIVGAIFGKDFIEPGKKDPNSHLVTRVVDGDTYMVKIDGKEEKVRIIGVDTPESVHPQKDKNTKEGKIASDYVKNLLEGKYVTLEYDTQERDRYGRVLAYVYLDDMMVNKHLLEEGYARLATFPPNVKYVDEFTKIEKKAQANNKGFWSNNDFETSPKPDPLDNKTGKYIGNINTKKFHYPDCNSVKNTKKANRVYLKTYKEAMDNNYEPCSICKPKK